MSGVNLTLLRLVIMGSYTSSLFRPAMRSGISTFSAYGCKSRRFFDSFFSTANPMTRMRIRSSTFKEFQNTAIILDSDWVMEYDISRRWRLYEPDGVGMVLINECIFSNCKGDYGGALKFVMTYTSSWVEIGLNIVRVQYCTFTLCSARVTGGAFYVIAQGDREMEGLNYLEFCCVGFCYVSGKSNAISEYERASGIWVSTGSRDGRIDNVRVDSCLFIRQATFLNCEHEEVESHALAGPIRRLNCQSTNITGSKTGDSGAFSSHVLDWFGNEEKQYEGKKSFEFVHIRGLSCQSCMTVGAPEGGDGKGMTVYNADIINITLIAGRASIICCCSNADLDVTVRNSRFMIIDGVGSSLSLNRASGRWSGEFSNCYTDCPDFYGISGVSYGNPTPYTMLSEYYCDYTIIPTDPFSASYEFTASSDFTASVILTPCFTELPVVRRRCASFGAMWAYRFAVVYL